MQSRLKLHFVLGAMSLWEPLNSVGTLPFVEYVLTCSGRVSPLHAEEEGITKRRAVLLCTTACPLILLRWHVLGAKGSGPIFLWVLFPLPVSTAVCTRLPYFEAHYSLRGWLPVHTRWKRCNWRVVSFRHPVRATVSTFWRGWFICSEEQHVCWPLLS